MKRIIVIIAGFLLSVPVTLAGAAQAAPPATAAAAAPGTAQADTVTQWNLTMIAGLEAAAVPVRRRRPPQAGGNGLCQHCASTASSGCHAASSAPWSETG